MVWHIHQTILIIGLVWDWSVVGCNPHGKLYQNLWITSSSYCKAQRQLLYVLSIELHLWNKLNMLSCSSMAFFICLSDKLQVWNFSTKHQTLSRSGISSSLWRCQVLSLRYNIPEQQSRDPGEHWWRWWCPPLCDWPNCLLPTSLCVRSSGKLVLSQWN